MSHCVRLAVNSALSILTGPLMSSLIDVRHLSDLPGHAAIAVQVLVQAVSPLPGIPHKAKHKVVFPHLLYVLLQQLSAVPVEVQHHAGAGVVPSGGFVVAFPKDVDYTGAGCFGTADIYVLVPVAAM